jgi:hypothetical protein
MNNVYTTSLQDTIYAGAISTSGGNAARQYWFRGKVTGDVDFMFGDAAAVFDHTAIYTVYHGTTATGTETIEAQNKAVQTGGAGDYSQRLCDEQRHPHLAKPGHDQLYFGASLWHVYSHLDPVELVYRSGECARLHPVQSAPLNDATYVEYNDQLYTDPAPARPMEMESSTSAPAAAAARALPARVRPPRRIPARSKWQATADSRPTIQRSPTPRFRRPRRSSTTHLRS